MTPATPKLTHTEETALARATRDVINDLRQKAEQRLEIAVPSKRATKRAGNAARREQTDFLVGCTLDERAYCIRLVRLLRDNYWMADFIRQVLDKEARSRWQWSLESLKDLLGNFATIEALASNAQKLGAEWGNHWIMRAIRHEVGDQEISDYKGSGRVRDLIMSAHQK